MCEKLTHQNISRTENKDGEEKYKNKLYKRWDWIGVDGHIHLERKKIFQLGMKYRLLEHWYEKLYKK